MGAVASLATRALQVEPGGRVSCEVKVRNDGSVVDELRFAVVGEAASWTLVEPPQLSLFPGADGGVQITFAPPKSANLTAGLIPFGVKVSSREDPEGSTVEEGTIELLPFQDLAAELVPRTSRGSRGAVHTLAIDNRGNSRARVVLSATDPDSMLGFAFAPQEFMADPGTAKFSRVKVVPRARFLRGPSVSRQFQVVVESDVAPPIPVDATMLQEPVLPPWFFKALLAALAILILLLAFWFSILKPEIKSAAKDAVDEEVEEQLAAAGITPGSKSGGDNGNNGGATTTTVAGGSTGGTTPGGTTPLTTPGGGNGDGDGDNGLTAGGRRGPNIDGRLSLRASGTTSFTVPEDQVLLLTDIVLQNPGGNTGTLSVQRNGVALLVVALENFRDLDYHFVTPILFKSGERLELSANCTSPTCTPGAYYLGNVNPG